MANDPNAALPYLEIAGYLAGQGVVGPDTDWPIYTGFMPAEPHQLVATFPAGGLMPEQKNSLRHPQVQIRVRGVPHDQTPPYEKIEEIMATLRGVINMTIGAGYYAHLIPTTDVLALGRDGSGRFEYTVTYRAARSAA